MLFSLGILYVKNVVKLIFIFFFVKEKDRIEINSFIGRMENKVLELLLESI